MKHAPILVFVNLPSSKLASSSHTLYVNAVKYVNMLVQMFGVLGIDQTVIEMSPSHTTKES